MKTWYHAVCDQHREHCLVMVSNPEVTQVYLGKQAGTIQVWLELHYGCALRLVHLDPDMDRLREDGYLAANRPGQEDR